MARLVVGRDTDIFAVPAPWRNIVAEVAEAGPGRRLAALSHALDCAPTARQQLERHLPGLLVLAQIGGAM